MTRAADAAILKRPAPDVKPFRSSVGWPRAAPIALAALVFSALYFVSDTIEAAQGGFSVSQLWLTLVAEAAIPVFVIGLARVHRPSFGRLGWASAWTYAYSYVFFTGTVVYALVRHTETYAELSRQLGPAMLVHGAIMVIAGIGFGAAVLRARALPRWTGVALMAGVVLVALTQAMPAAAGLAAAAMRDGAFAGMGLAVLRPRR
ncbi:MAG: putative rane protein [Frankiales bacterium]|nr:putative rane protein [Frankiales bacterium]